VGYLSQLFKLIVQANQNITFVGSRSSGPAQVAGKTFPIFAVDVSKMPTSELSSDGIHPNDQGCTYMAINWYAAIKDLLPQ